MSANKERYNKYFKTPDTVDQFVRKTSKKAIKLYNKNMLPLNTRPEAGDSIRIIPFKDPIIHSDREWYFIQVEYDDVVAYINVNDIATPSNKSRGESLGIQATELVKSGRNASESILLWGKEFDGSKFKEFTSARELADVINKGFESGVKIPTDVKSEMKRILSGNKFSKFDWGTITEQTHKNQVGKYYGELLVGMLILNNELGAFKGNIDLMLKDQKVESFLMPISPSFKAADSIIKTNKGIIPISNKKGGGTGASFFSNLVPLLNDMSDNVLRSPSNILIQLKDSSKKNKESDVIGQIYTWGFDNLIDIKTQKTPIQIYKKILTNKGKELSDINDNDIQELSKHIMKKKWKMRNTKWIDAVKNNLPHSLTHLFLYHLAEILTDDAKATDTILLMLGAKEYWQVDLQNKEWDNGEAVFVLKKSNETKIIYSPTRGAIDDITSSHAKLNYILK